MNAFKTSTQNGFLILFYNVLCILNRNPLICLSQYMINEMLPFTVIGNEPSEPSKLQCINKGLYVYHF